MPWFEADICISEGDHETWVDHITEQPDIEAAKNVFDTYAKTYYADCEDVDFTEENGYYFPHDYVYVKVDYVGETTKEQWMESQFINGVI